MLTKKHILLRMSSTDPDFKETCSICRRTKGAQLHPASNFWSFPRKTEESPIGYDDADEVVKYIKYELAKLKAARSVDFEVKEMPELTVEIPLKREMFDFQKQGVAYCLEHNNVLIGDQQGLGKTIQAIAAVVARNAFPCLVIAKNSLVLNWLTEIQQWTDKKAFIFKDSVRNSWPSYFQVGAAHFGIVNYDALQKYFVKAIYKPMGEALRLEHIDFKPSVTIFKSVIIDESHYVKDSTTIRTKLCAGLCRDRENVYLLSGTPSLNDAIDLYPQFKMLGFAHKFGSKAQFKKDFGGKNNPHRRTLNAMMRKFGYYRRTKAEVLKDLPEKTRNVVVCEIDNREEYNLAEQQFIRFLEERLKLSQGEINKKLRAEALVKMGELKKLSAKGKMQAVIDWGNGLIEDGQKFVVYGFSKEINRALRDSFPGSVSIFGEDSIDDRERNKKQFQENPNVPAIFCSISAASEGHTLTAASNLGLIEFPWHWGKAEQIEDRIHRIGQKDGATIFYFQGKDTVDEKVYSIIMQKKAMHNEVTGTYTGDEAPDNVIDSLIGLFAKVKKSDPAPKAAMILPFESDDF